MLLDALKIGKAIQVPSQPVGPSTICYMNSVIEINPANRKFFWSNFRRNASPAKLDALLVCSGTENPHSPGAYTCPEIPPTTLFLRSGSCNSRRGLRGLKKPFRFKNFMALLPQPRSHNESFMEKLCLKF